MLKPQILAVLSGCFDPRGYLSIGLRREVGLRLPSRPGDMEWSDALADLERGGFITRTADAITGDHYVKLTEEGVKAAAR